MRPWSLDWGGTGAGIRFIWGGGGLRRKTTARGGTSTDSFGDGVSVLDTGEDDADARARGGGDTRRGGTGLSVNQKEKAVRAQLPLDGPRRTGPAAE